jgi:hypothetical protein
MPASKYFTYGMCNREINTAQSEGEEDCAVVDFKHNVKVRLKALKEGSEDFEEKLIITGAWSWDDV